MRAVAAIRVPGDKSIAHRALMLAALSDGTSTISGLPASADVRSTRTVLESLGVVVADQADGVCVSGRSLRGLRAPVAPLDCGNSGTTARLMCGIGAAHPFESTLVGDESLSRRPMRRVADPLGEMGARIELSPTGTLPAQVRGGDLRSIGWSSAVASAQVKSSVLLAALVAQVPVVYAEAVRSRDHTERMLAARGVDVTVDGNSISLGVARALPAMNVDVPGDPSSAAFFIAWAALAARSIRVDHVCVNPTRLGFIDVVQRMGVQLRVEGTLVVNGEDVASVNVEPGATLRGVTVAAAEVPSLIDEIPIIACMGARAAGETVVTGAAELRNKESDRIAVVVANLRAIGADADERPDGLVVHGGTRGLRGRVATHGDHRIAMAFGVLAALPGNDIEIDDRDCVAVSYPEFWRDLAHASA